MCNELSRLEPVELRDVWSNEAAYFTLWLAEEENLSLLADTLNMELELEGREVNIESGIVDLLCRNTDDSLVLIENKLTETNHAHLGQILTYAAACPEATAFVWIAKSFQEKHRAALDRLNEITEERFQFFGVEIELWRIGDSPAAPRFNIVSSPNDWSCTVRQALQHDANRELSETQLWQQQYWTELREHMIQSNCQINAPRPFPKAFVFFPIGRAGFRLKAFLMRTLRNQLVIRLDMYGPNAEAHFNLLIVDREEIENEIGELREGEQLEWVEASNAVVLRKRNTDLTDEEDWPNQHAWLAEKLELFDNVFRHRVRDLNADDWQPAFNWGFRQLVQALNAEDWQPEDEDDE